MRIGFPASFLLHGGILAWALISLEHAKPFKPPEPEPVEVAIITEDGLTRLKQGDRNAKQLEAALSPPAPDSKAVKETPKPKPPEPKAPPPPAEEVKAEPPTPEPPKPEPKADPIADKLAMLPPEPPQPEGPTPEELARQQAEKKAAELKKQQEAAKKAADEKKRKDDLKKKQDDAKKAAELKKKLEDAKKLPKPDDFEAEMAKALQDKDPNKHTPPPPGGTQQALGKKGPTAGAPEGHDTVLTASQGKLLGSQMKRQVTKCWNINSGADGVDKIRIEVEVRFNPDGRIAAEPRVVSRGTGPLYADMSNSALRALKQCQPYDLPKDLYKGGWDFMIVEFDPSRMF